jgi:rsbT co-antagonist protein RsbR
MADHSNKPSGERTLMREMGLTPQNIERRKRYVALTQEDLRRIAAIKEPVLQNLDELAGTFFACLGGLEEARPLLSNPDVTERARRLKTEHLAAMVRGDYDEEYVEQRLSLGLLYSKVGLDTRVFLGAFHHLLKSVGNVVMRAGERNPMEAFENFMSLKKVAFFDLALIVDVLVTERERIIRQQQEAIRELSTPVLQIRDRLLLLPIIGVIDTHRAQLITESLLRSIRANRAKVVVVDVTGVATIDSKVANHLMQTVAAARLMGATAIVTGLSSDVAQSLVALGIDVDRFNTVGDLQGGVEDAERLLGYRVVTNGAGGSPASL